VSLLFYTICNVEIHYLNKSSLLVVFALLVFFVVFFSVWCFVDRCLSFVPFSFGHCVVCPVIYGFWLPLWYILTFLKYANQCIFFNIYKCDTLYFIYTKVYQWLATALCFCGYSDCHVILHWFCIQFKIKTLLQHRYSSSNMWWLMC
jgi:hypothetical protein